LLSRYVNYDPFKFKFITDHRNQSSETAQRCNKFITDHCNQSSETTQRYT
jgi:hypothetical protein